MKDDGSLLVILGGIFGALVAMNFYLGQIAHSLAILAGR